MAMMAYSARAPTRLTFLGAGAWIIASLASQRHRRLRWLSFLLRSTVATERRRSVRLGQRNGTRSCNQFHNQRAIIITRIVRFVSDEIDLRRRPSCRPIDPGLPSYHGAIIGGVSEMACIQVGYLAVFDGRNHKHGRQGSLSSSHLPSLMWLVGMLKGIIACRSFHN